MGNLIDLTGQKFGALTVLQFDHKDEWRNSYWLCQCDCGKLCIKNGHSLRRGHTTTCNTNQHRMNQYDVVGNKAYCILNNTGNKCVVSVCDFEVLSCYRWYEDAGYAVTWNNGDRIKMHRLIINAPEGMFVDHINHDTLDNRRENLRIVTAGQNNMNRKPKENVSGVNWCKATNKWRAVISVRGKPIHLGVFLNKEDAIQARLAAETQYYGKYSYHSDAQREATPWN